jgi:hypothetical protein
MVNTQLFGLSVWMARMRGSFTASMSSPELMDGSLRVDG